MKTLSYALSSSLSLLIITLSFTYCSAQPGFRGSYCSPTTGNYTTSSPFVSNLDTLLTDVTTQAANNKGTGGFYNLAVGENEGVDQVNGIALCRGDVVPSDCMACLSNATEKIKEACPNQKEAVVWFNECMLRYSNRSIFGSLDTFPQQAFYAVANWSDPDRFNQQLGSLLRKLQANAASGDSHKKFADGSASVTDFANVYALVECTPDLSNLDCSNCIEKQINYIPNCCSGAIGTYIVNPSCNLRWEDNQFYYSSDVAQSPPPPTNSSTASTSTSTGKHSKGGKTVLAIVVPTVIFIVLVAAICGWCLYRRKRWEKVESSLSNHGAEDEINDADSLQFDFGTISAATNNFSDANKLGRGGFGPVYKGILSNGEQVAVKRLAKNSGQGEDEFKNEVLLVAKLQHRNLVRLLGFCLERDERILIYEFVPKTSLDHFLFDPVKRVYLDWQTRNKIISSIARGLLYLHEDSRLRIIHRDLKASNILLDADMVPKISDFGMARLFQVDQTQGDTNRVVGTYGYMAPEYALQGLFSVKSDVYSFGVLVLEMITGRKSIGLYQGENSEDLISFVWRNWREGTIMNVVDETISTGSTTEIMRCVHIGLLCVQEDAADRPTMSSVVVMLSSHSLSLPVVSYPAYITRSLIPLSKLSEEQSSVGTKSSGSKRKSTQSTANEDTGSSQLLPR